MASQIQRLARRYCGRAGACGRMVECGAQRASDDRSGSARSRSSVPTRRSFGQAFRRGRASASGSAACAARNTISAAPPATGTGAPNGCSGPVDRPARERALRHPVTRPRPTWPSPAPRRGRAVRTAARRRARPARAAPRSPPRWPATCSQRTSPMPLTTRSHLRERLQSRRKVVVVAVDDQRLVRNARSTSGDRRRARCTRGRTAQPPTKSRRLPTGERTVERALLAPRQRVDRAQRIEADSCQRAGDVLGAHAVRRHHDPIDRHAPATLEAIDPAQGLRRHRQCTAGRRADAAARASRGRCRARRATRGRAAP